MTEKEVEEWNYSGVFSIILVETIVVCDIKLETKSRRHKVYTRYMI